MSLPLIGVVLTLFVHSSPPDAGPEEGFIDRSGRLVLDLAKVTHPRAELIGTAGFHEGRARVEFFSVLDEHLYGYIDRTGRQVIPPIFDLAHQRFSEGLACVALGDWRGFIDVDGKRVFSLPPGTRAGPFSEGLASFVDGKNRLGFLNRKGEIVIPATLEGRGGGRDTEFKEGLAWVSAPGIVGCGYIDHSGKFVIPPRYKFCGDFSEGLAWVDVKDLPKDRATGYIDKSGKMVIPPTFSLGTEFSQGRAAVALQRQRELIGGYIDRTGAWVVPATYGRVYPFSEGLGAVDERQDPREMFGRRGYVDLSGKLVIPLRFPVARRYSGRPFAEGLAAVMRVETQNKTWYGFIDRRGEEIIPTRYYGVGNFSEGLAYVRFRSPARKGTDPSRPFGPNIGEIEKSRLELGPEVRIHQESDLSAKELAIVKSLFRALMRYRDLGPGSDWVQKVFGDDEFWRREMRDPSDGKRYVMYYHALGDNFGGYILAAGTRRVVEKIHDGDFVDVDFEVDVAP